MKGYVGGLVSFRRTGLFAYRPVRSVWPMIGCQLHRLLGVCFVSGTDARQTMTFDPAAMSDDVQRFGRQEPLRGFQLESLSLAQNERWRQA
jgi:hypothetical protein